MNDSYCVICGKQLFQNGIRLTKLCYYIGAGYRRIDNNGWYADGTPPRVPSARTVLLKRIKKRLLMSCSEKYSMVKKAGTHL